jgi:hypothetical protein
MSRFIEVCGDACFIRRDSDGVSDPSQPADHVPRPLPCSPSRTDSGDRRVCPWWCAESLQTSGRMRSLKAWPRLRPWGDAGDIGDADDTPPPWGDADDRPRLGPWGDAGDSDP